MLGALSDMTGSSAGTTGYGLSPAIGAVFAALLAFVGFQGVRSASAMLLRIYALGSVLLLTAGLLVGLPVSE